MHVFWGSGLVYPLGWPGYKEQGYRGSNLATRGSYSVEGLAIFGQRSSPENNTLYDKGEWTAHTFSTPWWCTSLSTRVVVSMTLASISSGSNGDNKGICKTSAETFKALDSHQVHYLVQTNVHHIDLSTLFPGPAQLSVTCSSHAGRAWERG